MKKLWITLLALLMLPWAAAHADDAAAEGEYAYFVDIYDHAHITDWHWEALPEIPAVVTVPATLGGYPVMDIQSGAFSTPGLDIPFTIVVPEGITSIYGGFEDCGASEIRLPGGMYGIREGSFEGCHAVVNLLAENEHIWQRDGFLLYMLWEDHTVLLYTNPSPRRTSLPAVDAIGTEALANWIGDAQGCPSSCLTA